MTRITIGIATLCSVCFMSWGQTPPLVPTASLIATTSPEPNGKGYRLNVQNLRDTTLTALAFVASYQAPLSTGKTALVTEVAFKDPGIGSTELPIPASSSGSIRVGMSGPGVVNVKAALWADGTALGDPAYIHKLVHHRTVLKEHLTSALSILRAALTEERSTSLSDVVGLVKEGGTGLAKSDDPEDRDYDSYVESFVERQLLAPPRKRDDGTVLTARETIEEQIRSLQRQLDRLTPYL